MITIRQAGYQDRERWDRYVHQHADSTPYHLFAWGESVHNAYGHNPVYFIAEQEKSIVGLLPVVILSMPLRRDFICSLPYCDQAGILADDDGVTKLLLDQLLSFADENNIGTVELRQSAGRGPIDRSDGPGQKVRMLLNLPDSSTDLFGSFKSKLRSQINKSRKNGLAVSLQRADEGTTLVDDFYLVFSRNMRCLGSPVHGKSWFSEIAKNYRANAIIAVVKLDSRPVGAGIAIKTNSLASVPWASTLREYNSLAPNMLLYWSLLEYCSDHGVAIFDFGRSTFGEGTYNFKKQWGARAMPLEWNTYSKGKPNPDQPATKPASRKLRRTFETIWKKTPLWMTNRLGPRIRKYISL